MQKLQRESNPGFPFLLNSFHESAISVHIKVYSLVSLCIGLAIITFGPARAKILQCMRAFN